MANQAASFDGFTTHQLKNGMHLGLKIADLTLVLHGGDGTARVQTFSLNGRTEAQARQWLGEQLRARIGDDLAPADFS